MPASTELKSITTAEGIDLSEASILQLRDLVERLPDPERKVFDRIFVYRYSEAPLCYSSTIVEEHVAAKFKARTDEIGSRRSLRINNLTLGEETLFNPLRARRPIQQAIGPNVNQIEQLLKENPPETCDFCQLLEATPEDPFGRVDGSYCASAGNVGAYDAWHSLIIPRVHNPMELHGEILRDMIHTANKWLEVAHAEHPEARFPFICLNCLPPAGASVFHPHLSVLLGVGEPYRQTEELRRRRADYQLFNGTSYLDDLAFCLHPLGLVKDLGSARIIFNPAPIKEKEVFIFARDERGFPNGDLAKAIAQIIEWWKNCLGVTSFDMAIYLPAMGESLNEGDWRHFHPFARMVARSPSDFGSMEIYGPPVVYSDPLKLARSYDQYHAQAA